jgi:hypothetical protein
MGKLLQKSSITNTQKKLHYSLDTLEHINTNQCGVELQTTKKPINPLYKKAKNNYFSKSLARNLMMLDSKLKKGYKRTYFDCCNTIKQEGQKFTSRYCGARWCNNCNRIRTAKMLNGYLPVLEKLNDAQFVTLTIPNVIADDLKDTIRLMLSQSTNIVRTLKKRFKTFNGIRKIECTYNAITDDYHPHLHFIVEGVNESYALVNEWLKRFNEANDVAQDVRPITDLKELFKYQTKIITKTKNDFYIYLKPLDTIYCAMKNMRTFQSFGNIKKITDDLNDLKSEIIDGVDSYDLILWHWAKNDWVDVASGKHLTNYKPSKRMNELLTTKMIY